jgi:tRNA pseudouridine38-40 synthase
MGAARSSDEQAAPPAERNIRLLVEYDGTGFLGWQAQASGPSIQAALADALFAITGTRPELTAAGRTDAGVHALAQVVCFRVVSNIPGWRFAPALNSRLPASISVHAAEEVPLEFDPRRDSLSKRYRYRVYHAREPAALERTRAWHVRAQVLDEARMREAARHLVGELDFEAFRSAQCDAPHARREMFSVEIEVVPRPPRGRYVDMTFHADAFCRHMCRILAGNLVEVGLGRRRPEELATILASRDRTRGGVTAPPQGLTLLEIFYP